MPARCMARSIMSLTLAASSAAAAVFALLLLLVVVVVDSTTVVAEFELVAATCSADLLLLLLLLLSSIERRGCDVDDMAVDGDAATSSSLVFFLFVSCIIVRMNVSKLSE